jgi:hypothetical protein
MCFAVLAGWLSMAADVRIVQLRASGYIGKAMAGFCGHARSKPTKQGAA